MWATRGPSIARQAVRSAQRTQRVVTVSQQRHSWPCASRSFTCGQRIGRPSNADSPTSTTTSFASFSPQPSPSSSNVRVRTVFIGLTAIALIATGAGIYTYYGSFSTWPAEVRDDLRAAVKARHQQDWIKSEASFRKALQSAKDILPQGKLGQDGLLKLSGIQIALASMLEEAGELRKAFDMYEEAFTDLKQAAQTVPERLRAVSLAQRSGNLARVTEVVQSSPPLPPSTAEDRLVWSVEELLKLAVPQDTRRQIIEGQQGAVMLTDLALPEWLSRTTLGASLESLGQVYAAQGKSSLSVPLYVQAIDLVMPADKAKRTHDPTVAERCRAGILMNNVAQLMVDATEGGKDKPNVEDAQRWAIRGLDIVTFALRGTGWDMKGGQGFKQVEGTQDEQRTAEVKGLCWTAEVALLVNMGELARMQKDDCRARKLFQQAYQRADLYGMREVRSRCAQALSELERTAK